MKTVVAAVAASLALSPCLALAQDGDGPIVGKLRAALLNRNVLRDPMSAQLLVTKGPWHDSRTVFGQTQTGDFVCAKVNAKNGYGAYVGFRTYLFILFDGGGYGVDDRSGGVPELEAFALEKCGPAVG